MLTHDQKKRSKPVKLRLSQPGFSKDPAREFGKLLEMGPIFRGKIPMMGKVWLVTTWQGVAHVLRSSDDFVREPGNAGKKNYSWVQRLMPKMFERLANNMLTRDAEDHRRLRTLVDQAFQRQSIDRMSGQIEELVNRELDKIELSFRNGEATADFLQLLCRPMPLAVICEVLGLPSSDREKFSRWFAGFSNVSSFADVLRMLPRLRKTMKYLEGQFEIVRKHPRDGLITALVQAEENGDRLDKDELLSTVMLLLLAGHETTVHLISNSLLTLLQFGDSRQKLLNDWSLCDSAIDEVLRWCCIVQITKPRFVARDQELLGAKLQRGELIVPLLGCANFDPAEFDEPEKFLIDRSPNRHMTFGNGPHVCLGMKLAKAETRIAMQQIFQRWPDLAAGFDLQNPDFGKRLGMRTLTSLNLKPQ